MRAMAICAHTLLLLIPAIASPPSARPVLEGAARGGTAPFFFFSATPVLPNTNAADVPSPSGIQLVNVQASGRTSLIERLHQTLAHAQVDEFDVRAHAELLFDLVMIVGHRLRA